MPRRRERSRSPAPLRPEDPRDVTSRPVPRGTSPARRRGGSSPRGRCACSGRPSPVPFREHQIQRFLLFRVRNPKPPPKSPERRETENFFEAKSQREDATGVSTRGARRGRSSVEDWNPQRLRCREGAWSLFRRRTLASAREVEAELLAPGPPMRTVSREPPRRIQAEADRNAPARRAPIFSSSSSSHSPSAVDDRHPGADERLEIGIALAGPGREDLRGGKPARRAATARRERPRPKRDRICLERNEPRAGVGLTA